MVCYSSELSRLVSVRRSCERYLHGLLSQKISFVDHGSETALRVLACAGSVGVFATFASPAHAQYIGNARAISASARVLGATVDAQVSSAQTVLPSSGGSPAPVGTDVFAQSLTLVNGALNTDTDLVVNAEALTAQTSGSSFVVNSSAGVADSPSNPGTGLNIGVRLLGLTTTSLITATAVRTETFANLSGKSSRTIFTGLTITNLAGVALVGTDGRTYSNLDITFEDSDPTVGVNITGVASVLLHEKINNPDNSRTTNGIRVTLLSGPALGTFANAGVTVAQSTAGLSITAAPEPGAGALIGTGMMGVLAVARTRRRRSK